MLVSDVSRCKVDGGVELSAMVDGFRLWFRMPRIADELRAETLIAATLLPAMVVGTPLRIDHPLPVSPQFLSGVELIQQVTHAWNPLFQRILIEVEPHSPAGQSAGIGGYFSGGIDGTYTFLRHIDEIQYVAVLNGFDFRSDSATFARVLERNRRTCSHFGKELLPVETNYYEFGTRYRISRAATFGGLLASVSLSLGSRKTYIASSYGYLDMPAQGSHPMLDHLWSTESNEFRHDGAEMARTSKLEFVARHRVALDNLHVCWRDPIENCGNCAKCMRTMIALKLLGHDDRRIFSQRLSPDDIGRFPIDSDSARGFAVDNLRLAIRVGDQSIAAALRKLIWKYDARRLTVDLDRVMLGGAVQRLRKKLRPVAPEDSADIWPSSKGH